MTCTPPRLKPKLSMQLSSQVNRIRLVGAEGKQIGKRQTANNGERETGNGKQSMREHSVRISDCSCRLEEIFGLVARSSDRCA